MGTCIYCGQSTQTHCIICLVHACTRHMKSHYFSQTHKGAAAARGILLTDDGTPIPED